MGWKRQLENKDRGGKEMLFYFPDFLENSTHIPMGYRSQASVLPLFCRICVCTCAFVV